MRDTRRLVLVGAVIVSALAVGMPTTWTAAGAQRGDGCVTTQLTDGAFGANEWITSYRLSGDGAHVVFVSNGDHTGANRDGSDEVFRTVIARRATSQRTDDVGVSSWHPGYSGDGSTVVWPSTADPSGKNADRNTELFAFDVDTRELEQITDTTTADFPVSWGWILAHDEPRPDLDGDRVFFHELRESQDPGLPALGYGMVDLTAGVTSSVEGSDGLASPWWNVDVDDAGEVLVYEDDSRVFVHRIGAATTFALGADAEAWSSAINGEGDTVLYRSNGDPAGDNPDHVSQLFATDLHTKVAEAVVPATGRNGEVTLPARDAGRVLLGSTTDYFGDNPDAIHGPRLYLFDRTTGAVVRLPPGADAYDGSIDGTGDRVVFTSTADLTGQNADHDQELFLFDCRGRDLPHFHRPDLHLRGPAPGTWVGRDVYDSAAWGQRRSNVLRRGSSGRFVLRVENDGSVTERFRVQGPASNDVVRVRYVHRSRDVTAAVTGSGYLVGPLTRGQRTRIDVVVTVPQGARPGHGILLRLSAMADGELGGADVVRQGIGVR